MPRSREELDKLWSDPTRWNADGSYQGVGDPRLFVAKRHGGGWTLNVAHPVARWVMIGIVAGVLLLALGLGAYVARR